MTMRVGMKIVGLERLLSKLNALPGVVLQSAAADVQTQMEEVADIAKVLAPRDEGDLERGINARPVEVGADRAEGVVSSAAPHSIHVEYGTSEMSPTPFLRPATLTGGRERIARLGRVVGNAAEGV